MKKILLLFAIAVLHSPLSTLHSQCADALKQYAQRYPAAEATDLYKLVFQDLYGPGHLLTDSVAAARYIQREVDEMRDNPHTPQSALRAASSPNLGEQPDSKPSVSNTSPKLGEVDARSADGGVCNPSFPLYEYTLCDSNFVRVNLILVKRGVISLPQLVSAVLRSTEGMVTPDAKFVMSHSAAFKAAYDPHYRIVRRDIFEREILPLLSVDALARPVESFSHPVR